MNTTTLGELFPDMRHAAPSQKRGHKNHQKPLRKGTAQVLKALYPELESWNDVFLTKLWLHWRKESGLKLSEPDVREEAFPEYLLQCTETTMKEAGEWR